MSEIRSSNHSERKTHEVCLQEMSSISSLKSAGLVMTVCKTAWRLCKPNLMRTAREATNEEIQTATTVPATELSLWYPVASLFYL